MTTRTNATEGLSRPHKAKAAMPGNARTNANARSIDTEKPMTKKIGTGGLASTYYGNSRACDTESKAK
jgi:hypothetical protein